MTTPRFWYHASSPLILRPFAWLYGLARRLHVLATRPVLSPLPAICVGNITVGGAGKTPVVRALRRLLADRPSVVLSRGYGGTLPGPVMATENMTAHDIGDEAMIHMRDGPTMIARHRLTGLQKLAQRGGKTPVVLMDDGLQNRHITAHMNILVIDGTTGFGNGALLPAGPLREPLADVCPRVQAVVIIGEDLHHVRASLPPDLPIYTARAVYDTQALDKNVPYLPFAGLARPEKFFDALKNLGLTLTPLAVPFPDHHPYSEKDLRELMAAAERYNARLITTEKDIVKIPQGLSEKIAVLPMHIAFDNPVSLRTLILAHLPDTAS